MIYIYYNNNDFCKQIEYTFSTLFSILGLNLKFIENLRQINNQYPLVINYSNEILHRKNVINIEPSYLFSNKYLTMESMPKMPLKKYNEFPIIYSCREDNKECYVNTGNNCLITNIDIIQSSFFMITRYEEVLLWDKIEKDLYGRFPAKESLAHKENFLHIPIVNEYIEWLWQWIDFFNLGYKRKNIWGEYEFASLLTHDVDMPFKYEYPLKKDICNFKMQKAIQVYRHIFEHTLKNIEYKKDPFYTFQYIRNIEKRYNFSSSFYFMVGGDSKYDSLYRISDYRITKLINKLEYDGCEVGYHYSFNSYNSISKRAKEKQLLDRYVGNKDYGGRNHYLRFKVPESWNISEKVGLKYDTTLGYADLVGFRCGICHPYRVFDILENRELNIWEIPLTLMEGSLRGEKYMNLNSADSVEVAKKIIDIVKKYKGVFTLLWHNSSFDKEVWAGWKRSYEHIMKYIFINNSLGGSGKEILHVFNSCY
ncbi:hypothetical protein N494_12895 [Clostridium botulinum A2B7 92]|uniref:polysaccharide deacetylase family protein n=1 Tax=Clostridium botulinum TaxID=1491 RepID=UPI0007DF18AB|nr:polysaccharide deacetylase family protein [Clostridium botulinum]KEI97156.1 hypothetical protein N494_12895 [Clostridium botulinum A2B7 92]